MGKKLINKAPSNTEVIVDYRVEICSSAEYSITMIESGTALIPKNK